MSPRKVYLDQLLRIPASGHYKCINSFYKYFFVNVQQVLNPRLGSKRGFDDILGLYFDLCPGSRVQDYMIGYWVLGIGYWVLGIGYWVLGIGYQRGLLSIDTGYRMWFNVGVGGHSALAID